MQLRLARYYAQGARFAKWRNVLQIDPEKGIPSDFAIDVCVKNLAQYAAICQAPRRTQTQTLTPTRTRTLPQTLTPTLTPT